MSEETTATAEVQQPEGMGDLEKKMKLKGTVTRLELYGAFVDIGLDTPAILHISQLGRRVNRVSDVLEVDQEVTLWVDKIDNSSGQVTVTMQEPLAVEWSDLEEGAVYDGKVTRLESFGAFIDIGAEKEGLAHVSELSYDYVKHPSEVVKVGDVIPVKVLGFSRKRRRINLSMKALQERPEADLEDLSLSDLEYEDEPQDTPTAMEWALRNAMNRDDSAPQRARRKKKRRGRRMSQDEIIQRTLEMAGDEE